MQELENTYSIAIILREFYNSGYAWGLFSCIFIAMIVLTYADYKRHDIMFEFLFTILHWIQTCYICMMVSVIPFKRFALFIVAIVSVPFFIGYSIYYTYKLIKRVWEDSMMLTIAEESARKCKKEKVN